MSTDRCRPRRYQVDPWSKGRALAGGALRPYPKKIRKKTTNNTSLNIRNVHIQEQKLYSLYILRNYIFAIDSGQDLGGETAVSSALCAPATDRVLLSYAWAAPPTWHRAPCKKTAILGRVGARRREFMTLSFCFVDRCLSRTRNLAASK